MKIQKITDLLTSMILIGTLVPIGLLYIVNSNVVQITLPTLVNGTYTNVNYTLAQANPLINTLLGTIVPIMIIIGIMMYFVPRYRNK